MERWVGERVLHSLEDPNMLGPWFSAPESGGDTWWGWKAIVKATFALDMDEEEIDFYKELTNRSTISDNPFNELDLQAGRRAGKGQFLSAIATIMALAVDYSPYKSIGETVRIMVLSNDRDQAGVMFNYIKAYIENVPLFWSYVDVNSKGAPAITSDSIILKNGVEITVQTASFKGVRGRTTPVVIFDEIAFFNIEGSSNPGSEIVEAIRPSTATIPNSLIIKCSSPYTKQGVLWEEYKENYGNDEGEILFIKAPSWKLNPTLPMDFIEKQYKRDPEVASREYGAEYAEGGTNPITHKVLEQCTIEDRYEIPPDPSKEYVAFTDPSGGSRDSFTLAIAHRDDESKNAVVDVIRERLPPFDPDEVIKEFSKELQRYGIDRVIGDAYGGEFPRSRYKNEGIVYEVSKKNRSELYQEVIPMLNTGEVELLDHEKTNKQFLSLERKSGGSGKDRIDHPPRQHDDCANATAGALAHLDASAPMKMFVF